MGEFIKSLGEENQVVKRGREYDGYGEKYIVGKKGMGKQYHLPYNIRPLEEYHVGEGDEKFRGRK